MNTSGLMPVLKVDGKTGCRNGLHGAYIFLNRICPARYRLESGNSVRSNSLPLLLIIFTVMLFMTSGCAGGSNASLLVPGEFGISQTENEKLLRRLDSFDPGERKHAAKLLGKTGPVKNRYIPSLIKILESSSSSERIAAVSKVGECGIHMAETTDALCRVLWDTEPKVCAAAARSLRRIAGKLSSAFQSLEQIRSIPGEESDLQKLKTAAEKACGDLLPQIQKIEEALIIFARKNNPVADDDTEHEVKTEGMVSLAENPISDDSLLLDSEADSNSAGISNSPEDDDALSPELRRKMDELDGFSTRKRRNAAQVIEWICSEKNRPIADHVSLLQNRRSDTSERTTAVDSIETLARDMEGVVSVLCRAMQDVDDQVRIHSAAALGTITGAFAVTVKPLEAAIEKVEQELKENSDMQDSMTDSFFLETFKRSCEKTRERVLGMMGESLTALAGLRDLPSYVVRDSAAAAIRKIVPGVISSDMAPAKIKKKETSEELEEPEKDIASLPYDEKEIKLFLLMHDLENPYVSIARKAAGELGAMGPEAAGAVPALIKAIRNRSNWYEEYHYVREESIRALGKIGPSAESAVPLLIELLDEHHNTTIRGGAATSLALIGKDADTVVPLLVDLIGHAHSTRVIAAVAEALGYFASGPYSGACYGELLKALENSAGNISLNAFKSLSTYETQNRGTGLVKWEPLEEYVDGYQVCLKSEAGNFVSCIDTEMATGLNLGQFSQFQKDTHQIEVQARRGLATFDVPWTYVDVVEILTEGAEKEKDPEVKKEKIDALANLAIGKLP